VGDPKPSSKEFFSDRDPLYRSYGKQEALLGSAKSSSRDPAFERRGSTTWARLRTPATSSATRPSRSATPE
jgi:hypothetical protein